MSFIMLQGLPDKFHSTAMLLNLLDEKVATFLTTCDTDEVQNLVRLKEKIEAIAISVMASEATVLTGHLHCLLEGMKEVIKERRK